MFSDIGAIKLHYDVNGEGNPLILVHGSGADAKSWEEMIPHLAKHFKVYAIDLRGAGKTFRSIHPPLSFDLWAEDLHRFMDNLGLSSASLAGWSLGGVVILNFAMYYPKMVSHLILIGTPSPLRQLTDRSGFDERVRLAESGASIEEIVDKTFEFSKNAFSPYTLQNKPQAVEKMRQTLLRNDPKSYVEIVKTMKDLPKLAPKLGSIKCPTLILVGDADARTPVEMSEDLNKAIVNSYMKIIPECGHFYVYEQPELTSQIMINFLRAFSYSP